MGNLEQAMKDECLEKVDNKEVWKCALDVEEKGMNLEKLYKMQEELDNYIIKNRNIVMNDEELLNKTILALLVEIGELANATRCFKHWSTKGPESKERILEELADAWHFYLSIGNQKGLNESNNIPLSVEEYEWWVGEDTRIEDVFIAAYKNISEIVLDTQAYGFAGTDVYVLGRLLGFTDEEIEQAYLKKHEENYRRQREGY